MWLHLGDAPIVVDDDDDTLEETTAQHTVEEGTLCLGCGVLGGSSSCTPSCRGRSARTVRKLRSRNGRPSGCLSCGARGVDMVRRLESGN